ncbi:DUF3127 domain-containing protein [Nibrella saemangeumensis]|uniref:DUF3127 domain-containing protein n=1 Tax=Nibrella saemangeumensis TaxID=1084526 RepID=A0ABP8MJJ9_9BACT
MALELTGKLVKVMPEVTGQGKNGAWNKQEFVIETIDQFPKKVCMTAWGEKANDLKQFTNGDTLKVTVNIESREYNDRWYTDVRAWRIELLEGETIRPDQPKAAAQPAGTPFGVTFEEEGSDLPF